MNNNNKINNTSKFTYKCKIFKIYYKIDTSYLKGLSSIIDEYMLKVKKNQQKEDTLNISMSNSNNNNNNNLKKMIIGTPSKSSSPVNK
jgi:hypothetical protein